MKDKPQLFDVIALVRDDPSKGLVAGHVGTIIELLPNEHFEVEFCDESGVAYAQGAFHRKNILLLHYNPIAA